MSLSNCLMTCLDDVNPKSSSGCEMCTGVERLTMWFNSPGSAAASPVRPTPWTGNCLRGQDVLSNGCTIQRAHVSNQSNSRG